jgi:hypothetical protein
MAQVPSTRWTALDVLSSARELAKTVDQKKVLQEQGKYFYKAALSEIVTLLNSSVDPSYHVSTPLTLGTDFEILRWSNLISTDLTALTVSGSTLTITRTTGLFTVGSLLYINRGFWTGVESTQSYYCVARVITGGATATCTIIAGSIVTITMATTNSVACIVEKANTTNPLNVDISTILYDRIVSIEDSINGECVEVTPQEFASLGRSTFQHKSYDDDIVWCLFGNTIRFHNGAKITAGTKTMWYQRQPNYPTLFDDTEYVDLADKWIPLLIKRIYTFLILQTENDIPKNLAQEMQLDYQQISGYTTAEISNRTKPDKQVSFISNKQ